MTDGNLDNIVLALLFSADEPLSLKKLSSILENTPASDIKDAIERWSKRLDDESWSIVLEKVAGGMQLSTRPEYATYIARMYSGRRKLRLSKAALESLAIIAYKQPITRAEIETIRGVGCGGVVANLLERSLIRITGKAKVLGAPYLYGTTQEFLEYLGLNSLKDLPSMEELENLLEREESTGAAEADGDSETPGAPPTEEASDEGTEGEAPLDSEEEDVVAVESGSARLGPGIDEPYHRPMGDDGGPHMWPDGGTDSDTPEDTDETEDPDSPDEPDDVDGRDEDLPHDRKE